MKKFLCAMLLLTAMGCGGGGLRATHYNPGPPPEAPAVPARQNVPIDPALREQAKNELVSASQNPDPVIRANALEAMQDTLGDEAGDAILRGLNDNDGLVRFAAAMAAGKIRLQAAYVPLTKLLFDQDDNVKVGVRFALHRLGDPRRSHDFETLARNDSRGVRGNVALALGMLGDPSAVNVLRPMMNDRDPIVRYEVAEAMWRLGDEEGLKALVVGTISEYGEDQAICVLALAQPRDSRVAPHIWGKLTSNLPEVALVAARAMGMVGSDAGYGVALNNIRTPDPRKKALAALAFGQIGRSDAQPILAPLLKDHEQSVRVAAATAILQLKSG